MIVKDKEIDFSTCLAHFMQYVAFKKEVKDFELHGKELVEKFYFKDYYETLLDRRDGHYEEYRRQRDFLESKHGFQEVDHIIESCYKDWRKNAEPKENEVFTMNWMRDTLHCAECKYSDSATDDNFCDIFNKGVMPSLFMDRCPAFTSRPEEPGP